MLFSCAATGRDQAAGSVQGLSLVGVEGQPPLRRALEAALPAGTQPASLRSLELRHNSLAAEPLLCPHLGQLTRLCLDACRFLGDPADGVQQPAAQPAAGLVGVAALAAEPPEAGADEHPDYDPADGPAAAGLDGDAPGNPEDDAMAADAMAAEVDEALMPDADVEEVLGWHPWHPWHAWQPGPHAVGPEPSALVSSLLQQAPHVVDLELASSLRPHHWGALGALPPALLERRGLLRLCLESNGLSDLPAGPYLQGKSVCFTGITLQVRAAAAC